MIKIPINRRLLLAALLLSVAQVIAARCGETRYDWGADALHEASVFVLAVMEYTVGILYSIATLTALYSVLRNLIRLSYNLLSFV